ncbi:MAG: multicopper oxidase domain-containing protein [Defluviimonas sp.]|uniref:multicopper oxidase domain-containing protein n=1 Tax=Albidovulum sp. TaxID=1872424 RepID=UPI001DEFD228|nr:multicopper oxidase domain-containing protein [Paracoccaceae bacterium]MCC0064025.1 multicopper oxidase domain-containing protein [Defluviimonas sp.]
MSFIGPITRALCAVGLGWATLGAATAHAETRTYYIAAEEIDWNYAPEGREMMMGMEFDDDQKVFVEPGPSRIGSVYHKVHYVGYTDADFTTRTPLDDPSMGILGPVIRAEVGDEIEVVLKNASTVPVSAHPHGVFYNKDAEGAMTNDGTTGADRKDDMVMPGETYTYHWGVPERAGPGPNDGSSVVWLYHSHVHSIADTNSGLVGPMVITAKGMANPDGSPKDVDREFFSFYSVLNENESLFLDDMIAKLPEPPGEDDEEEFEESNLMHSINGYVYGNMPMPQMHAGDHVRWYVMTLGTEVDLHTPHWHGNTVLSNGHRKDVVELLPATTLVADMVPDAVGVWMYHCHVNDHIAAGMTGRYEVLPAM